MRRPLDRQRYVDQAEGRRPVLELMNELGYDVATLGNHEFDVGQQTLAEAIGYCRFPVICATWSARTRRFRS